MLRVNTVAIVSLIILLTGCSEYGAWDLFARMAPDDLSSYNYRHRLIFNNSAQSEAFTSFPVLVALTPGRVDYTKMNPGGSDVRFVDGDTGNVIPHEVEVWNYGATSLYWVLAEQIDGSSATDCIWLYYGSDSPPAALDPNDVWDAGYLGVWHLHSDLNDSTNNAHNGIDAGTVAATGVIGQGREFSGIEYIRITETPVLDIAASLTLEAWGYKRATTDQVLLAKTQYAGNNRSYAIGYDYADVANGPYVELTDDGTHKADGFEEAPGAEASDTWMHVAGVYDTDIVVLYVNGFETGRRDQNPDYAALFLNDRDLMIGASHDGNINNFDGYIDEVRISNVPRSADWLAAQYLSMTDVFISYGAREDIAN